MFCGKLARWHLPVSVFRDLGTKCHTGASAQRLPLLCPQDARPVLVAYSSPFLCNNVGGKDLIAVSGGGADSADAFASGFIRSSLPFGSALQGLIQPTHHHKQNAN